MHPDASLIVTPFLGIWEPVSSLLHLSTALVVLLASPWLLRLGISRRRVAGLMAFIGGAVLLLMMSGIYHALEPGSARDLAQRLDHAAIWTLIVGTFTPIVVVTFRGVSRKVMVTSIWAVAIAGGVLKTVFFTEIPEWVGLVFYVGFGWLGAIYCIRLARKGGWASSVLCLAGGVSYTTGAVLEFARTPLIIPQILGPHELFHITIVLGVVLHWACLTTLMRHAAEDHPEGGAWWDARSKWAPSNSAG